MAAVFGAVLQMGGPSSLVLATNDLVLSERIMSLSKAAADLSTLAYQLHPPGNGFDFLVSFAVGPDQQALVARKNGYCFAAFRGTTMSWDDWQE